MLIKAVLVWTKPHNSDGLLPSPQVLLICQSSECELTRCESLIYCSVLPALPFPAFFLLHFVLSFSVYCVEMMGRSQVSFSHQ